MPLLRKKPFVPLDLPPDLKADEEVFLNVLTKEIFRDYEAYFRRSILCNSLVWSCEYTGKCNLTLPEALASEEEAAQHLAKMQIALQQGICWVIHKNNISSLTAFVDEVLLFYKARFLVGERVEIISSGKVTTKTIGTITDIKVDPDASYHHPNQILYKCTLSGGGNQVTIPGNKLCREKSQLTRERVKLLAKCSAKKVSTEPPLYAIKPEHVTRLKLDNENFIIPYLGDYGKLPPKIKTKRKAREADEEEFAPQNKKKKKKKSEDDWDKKETEVKISAEERRRLIEEERARKKRERAEEKENQRKLQLAEQAFQKEWTRARADLELNDSKELPTIPPVNTALPPSLFGDMLQVAEFFHLFGEHVDLIDDFPDGIMMGTLEACLIRNKQDDIFCEMIIFLLKLVFALQQEEDEEETKFAERYNYSYINPTLNDNLVKMTDSVTWSSVVEQGGSDPVVPWAGASQAFYFTQYYLGTTLCKLQLDSYTVTEVLRLHILSAGGRNSGQPYYGRWRFNHRGMYSDSDNPCVELRNGDPSLMSMLAISNIFDLPPASKLTLLTTLINEVLTFAQFREIIEEAVEGSREAKKEWKSFGAEIQRKEKEHATNKYKEWVASRIKIKEDKRKKKKGRLSELKDLTLDSDISLTEIETDVSQLIDEVTTADSLLREEAARAELDAEHKNQEEEKLINKTQEFHLYTIFREVSCKLKVNPLGVDRYYRTYFSFHCTPGIFVEESGLDICSLYQDLKSEDVSSNSSYQLTSAHHLNHDVKSNGIKSNGLQSRDEHVKQDREYFINGSDNLPVPGAGKDGPQLMTAIDPATMSVEEISLLKLREADRTHGQAASTYASLCSTPGFSLLNQDQPAWSHLTSEEAIRSLLETLNPRGERERELHDNISSDLTRILHDLETRVPLKRYNPEETADEEEASNGEETEEQRTARIILKKTSAEKLTEASLREQIADLENRIFEANFGAVKVKNRMAWRQEIEDFWLDDSLKYKKSAGDVPEIPGQIIHQRLMALRASQNSSSLQHSSSSQLSSSPQHSSPHSSQNSNHSDQDVSSLTSGSSTVVSRRSIITKLSQALLSVERGIPAKYLAHPLGETDADRRRSSAPALPGKLQCETSQIERWRASMAACTSLSQILLHIYTLDASILWGRSILKTNCRICRRRSDPGKILLCDGCDRGQHLYCLKPKLKNIPTGKWYCAACKPTVKQKRTRAKLVEISSDEEEESEEEDEEEDEEEELPRTRPKRKSTLPTEPPPKSLSEKLRSCEKLVALLMENEDGWPFLYPVDGSKIPDYYDIIPNPMDMTTIQSKLKSRKYRKLDSFIDDVEQIFLNCKHYNTAKAPAYKAGIRLQKLFDKKLAEFGLQ